MRTRDDVRRQLKDVRAELAATGSDAERRNLRARLHELRGRLIEQPDRSELFNLLEPDTPLVLLPVRLETSWSTGQGGISELLVRVYPDDIHVDTHEAELTEDEEQWGRQFHQRLDTAEAEESRVRAWQQLAERFGAPRAAWIALTVERLPAGEPAGSGLPNDETLPRRAESWTRAPRTIVLPDCWVALGYRSGRRLFAQWGKPIPESLSVGPDPASQSVSDETAVDEGMAWMVDFDAAERVGMGLRIELPAEAADGLDRMIVLGVKATLDAEGSREALQSLIEAHHYTRGFGFVPQDTPTNNTDDVQSGYRSRDHDYRASYTVERGADPVSHDPDSDGYLTAAALGLPPQLLAHLTNAGGHEQRDARHMNAALWPATLGYFFEQMMAEVFPGDVIARIRRHFIGCVRARGPLPAWRVGDEPYGVLPVQSLAYESGVDPGPEKAFDPSRGTVRELAPLLSRLIRLWLSAAEGVPRVGTAADPGQTLLQILSTDGVSSSYAARTALGHDYLRHLFAFIGWSPEALETWRERWWEHAAAGLRALQLDWQPRLAWCVYDSKGAFELSDALVQHAPLSELAPLEPNYIALIRNATWKEIRGETFDGGSVPDSLLYVLLRHGALLTYAGAARAMLLGLQMPPMMTMALKTHLQASSGWREPELVDISSAGETTTPFRLLEVRELPVTGGMSIGEHLDRLHTSDDPRVQELLAFKESLRQLEQRPSAVLQRLLVETLDLCSHRLDAWITSIATARLNHLRETNPDGVQLAGYGWVENLKRSGASPSFGYVHAPSLAHGVTAAVLHSHRSASEMDDENLAAIDLSSQRVRTARWLLDGIRNGQTLGALLGYRFERGLLDRERLSSGTLRAFIDALRRRFETAANTVEEDEIGIEPDAAGSTLDGLALLTAWREQWQQSGIPFHELGVAAPSFDFVSAIQAELSSLAAAVGAVNDAVTAESVFQTAQGNPVRTAATLDAIARADAPPPEPEFSRTPRTGRAVTHRVLLVLPPEEEQHNDASWPITPRAIAEPGLNQWLIRLLPDPANVRCRVRYSEPKTDGSAVVTYSETADLTDLVAETADGCGLAPIDLLFLVEAGRTAVPSEIERRLRLHALRHRPPATSEDPEIQVDFDRDAAWDTDLLGYSEFFQLVRDARLLVNGLRALEPADLQLPEDEPPETAAETVRNLLRRVRRAVNELARLRQELYAALHAVEPDGAAEQPGEEDSSGEEHSSGASGTLEEARGALRRAVSRAAWFDLETVLPPPAVDAAAAHGQLLQAARALLKEIQRRERLIPARGFPFGDGSADDAVASGDSGGTERETMRVCREALQIVFGNAFPVVPRFEPRNRGELDSTFAASQSLQGGDVLPSVSWLQHLSRVREPLHRLYNLLMRSEVLSGRRQLVLDVGQVPHVDGDRWVGLPHNKDAVTGSGSVSLVICDGGAAHDRDSDGDDRGSARFETPVAGFLVDEIVEVIPNREETTAVTFQFDEPRSRAPQAVLLAVLPEDRRGWTLEALESTVIETIELARMRAVDPDYLPELGHFLPALYFARNAAGDTVESDFTRLAREPQE